MILNEHIRFSNFRIYGKIHYNYAEFTFEQKFYNNYFRRTNAKYVLPIISDIQLSNLSISIGNETSMLNIREPPVPLKSSEKIKDLREKTYIQEKLQETDIMVYDVKGIQAYSCIEILATYVCKTEQTNQENYLKLKIPKILFGFNAERGPHSAEFNIIRHNFHEQHNSFVLESGNLITLEETYDVAIFKTIEFSSDIELIYYYNIPAKPYIIAQKDLRINRYAFHISCPVDPEVLAISQSGKAGNYVLLLDRSSSMIDWKNVIVEAAALFIRSLPENCYFNVISFGERFEGLFKTSKKYDKPSADEAVHTVLQYENCLGWPPNFLDPLKYLLKKRSIPEYPLKIFVITNGTFWDNKREISSLVKEHENIIKLSIVGVSTNEPFIEDLAKIGKGTCQVVDSADQIKPAVLSSLKQALVPAYTNICISDYRLLDVVWPRDSFNRFIDEEIEISGVFKKGKLPKHIWLRYQCDGLGLNSSVKLEISEDQIVDSSSILVLEAKECLHNYTKQLAIAKSKEYKIEGDYTSFSLEKYTKKQLETFSPKNEEATTIKSTSAIVVPQKNTRPKTRSTSNKTGLALQNKRERSVKSIVAPPVKKAKIYDGETSEAIYQESDAFKENKRNEVKCVGFGYEIEKIIHLQYPEGYWEFSASLSDAVNGLIGYSFDVSNLTDASITPFIVALFCEKFKDYKCLWDLVIIKSKWWLAKNNQKLIMLSEFNIIND